MGVINLIEMIFIGTYKDGVSPNGLSLSDHMTLGAVVATILIIDNTAQVCIKSLLNIKYNLI